MFTKKWEASQLLVIMTSLTALCPTEIMPSAVNKNCFRSFTCRCLVSNKSNLLFSLEQSYTDLKKLYLAENSLLTVVDSKALQTSSASSADKILLNCFCI